MTDTKSVMDQAIRILQAMIDVSGDAGWLATTLHVVNLLQMILQARWNTDSTLLCLPHLEADLLHLFRKARRPINSLAELIHAGDSKVTLSRILRSEMDENQISDIIEAVDRFPKLRVSIGLKSPGGKEGPVEQSPEGT